MRLSLTQILVWTPRILALALAFFLSLFVLDIFNQGYSSGELVLALAMQLIPAEIIVIFTIFSWNKPGLGAILFTVVGTVYIVINHSFPWVAYLFICGPIYFIAVLFVISNFYANRIERLKE